jgi:predicted N-formylglutamate amidohydrolase
MSETYREIAGSAASGLLIVVDHASNHVPPDIDLGISPDLLDKHIASDIGAAALGQGLCKRFGCPGLFGGISRLVLDLHREPDSPGLIPAVSDGHAIPGNATLIEQERQERVARFWKPYHSRLSAIIDDMAPELIAAVHSFTPRLETSDGPDRPWEIGILYNRDDRAARIAIDWLQGEGLPTGDNEPYSGKLLNATMNMHAEAQGIPYLAIEVRNDLVGNATGIMKWTNILESLLRHCRNKLARRGGSP